MDKGFKHLKLVLLGVVIISVPILFIFQNEAADRKNKENEEYKLENAKLETYNKYLKDLIHFYQVSLNTAANNRTKQELPSISFNPVINIPESGSQNTTDYSNELRDINNSIKTFSVHPDYSQQLESIANGLKKQPINSVQNDTFSPLYYHLAKLLRSNENKLLSIQEVYRLKGDSIFVLKERVFKDGLKLEILQEYLNSQNDFLNSIPKVAISDMYWYEKAKIKTVETKKIIEIIENFNSNK